MTQPNVLVNVADGVATVTLNRPEAMNALSARLRGELTALFGSLQSQSDVEVVVLTGAGRAFCAGLDLKELGSGVTAVGASDSGLDVSAAIGAFDRPIIGAINGFAITGGFEIALMCDLLICSREARFADTHARVGVFPGWGLSQRLPRLIGPMRAKELSLTGNFLSAERAYEWGMVNRVVESDELMPTALALAQDMLTTEREVRGEILRVLDDGWATTLGDGLKLERERSDGYNRRTFRSERLAELRAGVQQRGRSQSDD